MSIVEDMDMVVTTTESTALTTAADDDPESQEQDEQQSLSIFSTVHRNLKGNKYENVFTIDDDDLGSDPNVLMIPLSYRKRRCINRWIVLPSGILFAFVTLSLGVSYLLSVNGIQTYYNPFKIGHVKNVPKDLANQCSTTALKTTEGWKQCSKTCSVAKCCVIPINHRGSCLHKYEKQCSKYFHSCKVMFDSDGVVPTFITAEDNYTMTTQEEQQVGSPSDTKPSGGAPPTYDKESGSPTYDTENGPSIIDICSPAAISTSQGEEECKDLCYTRSCCFTNGSDNCYEEKTSYCDEYHICSTQRHSLNLTPGNPNLEMTGKEWAIILDTMTNVCMQDATPPYHLQDGANCYSYCQDLKCCFSQSADDSCFNQYEDYCDQFYMCGVMYNVVTNDEESETTINSNKNAPLTKSPPSIQELCSDQYIIQNGQIDCEKKCNDRECCFIPEQNKDSCFLKNRSWCEEYVPCTKLDKYNGKGNNNKDKNKNNKEDDNDDIVSSVKQACYVSPVKASTTGYAKCANLCQSRMCCFQTDDNLSCYKDKTDWCEEFSACYKLNINDFIGEKKSITSTTATTPEVDETELKVEEACSENNLETLSGMANCGKLCVDKQCCFDSSDTTTSLKKSDGSSNKSCDKKTCEEYKSCKSFFTQTSKSKLELESLCTHDKISDNYNTCSNICSQRSCCFQWGSEGNCYNNNESWCDEFHPCYNLNWVDVSKEQTSTLISEACSKMNVITEAGRERCLSLCEDHTCCFAETDDNCYKQEIEFCVGYEQCNNLYISPHDMIEEFCDEEKVDTALGYSVCAVLCTARSCCFQDKENSDSNDYCYDKFEPWCDEFSACRNIASITSVVNSYNTDSDGYIVSDVCSIEKLQSDDGIKDCQDICSERYCCFEIGSRMNCYGENTQWCDEFSACKNLDTLSGNGSSTSTSTSTTAKPKEQLQKDIESKIDDICSDDNISTPTGIENCKEYCEEHACCFSLEEGLNCWDEHPLLCTSYRSCQNLMYDYNENDNDDDDNDNEYNSEMANVDIEKLNAFCTKDAIDNDDNYNTCRNICSARECCFHWGKENCVEEKEDWCDDFSLCYNLDWADVAANANPGSSEKDDLLFVVNEACSKLNVLTEAGRDRCEEICDERECCFNSDLTQNCWSTTPELCEEYEPCSNLNLKDEDLLEIFCSKDKVVTGLGYSVCSVLCTTRPCCFVEGPGNCAKEFPSWCSGMDICAQNLDMPSIMKSYNGKTDGNIVQKICTDVESLPEAHEVVRDCKELCSERGCCFLPGRDNCSNKYKDWCDEFAPCGKLNLFETDDRDDDDYDDVDSHNDDNQIDDYYSDDPKVQEMENVCSKTSIIEGDNYNTCKNLCSARECCFHWGRENCMEEKEDWCDDFRLCYNLDWADIEANAEINAKLDDNSNSKTSKTGSGGDLLFVITEACSKFNIVTEAGESRCEELCEDKECCWSDHTKSCFDDKPGYCDGYEACATLNLKIPDIVEEFCDKDLLKSEVGYIVCEDICTGRQCCFLEDDNNCAKIYPAWCSEVELCSKNLDMKTILSTYTDKTEASIVEKVCNNVGKLPEGHRMKKDCRQVCSERACCWLPGRGNCSDKNKDWCDEFSPCLELNLFHMDNDDGGDGNDKDKSVKDVKIHSAPKDNNKTGDGGGSSSSNSASSNPKPTNNAQPPKAESTTGLVDNEILKVNVVCTKENVKSETGRYNCENMCKERSCCFSVGFGNCYATSEEWCDEYKACENLFMH